MFLFYAQVDVYQNILKLLAFILCKAFKKKKNEKRGLKLASLSHFLHDFWRKLFLTLFYLLTKFHCLTAFTSWVLGNMCIVITCCLVYDVMNFEINHTFLIKPFYCITRKSGQKCKYLKNEKSFSHEIKNIFSSFLKCFRLSEIVLDPRGVL